jgi:hypothetical protein
MERVATAREAASRETFNRVVHLLTARHQVELDELLVVDNTIGSTRLTWLGQATRGVCAGCWDASWLVCPPGALGSGALAR